MNKIKFLCADLKFKNPLDVQYRTSKCGSKQTKLNSYGVTLRFDIVRCGIFRSCVYFIVHCLQFTHQT